MSVDWGYHVDCLRKAGVEFAAGLSELEFRQAEEAYEFVFPSDLREFLMFAFPVSRRWPNWRDTESSEIHDILNGPYDGICFDIEYNRFWPNGWGIRPEDVEEAFAIAKQHISAAPKLIPIYGHRYLPDRPREPGNPVFSVVQTDIIYYGSDLTEYFENEFYAQFRKAGYHINEPTRRIEFWSDIVDVNDGILPENAL